MGPEAEAKADSYYGYGYGLGGYYGGLGYAGYGHGVYGYGHGLGYGYGYGLGHGVYYGKRSADAKADPYLLYGGLGYTGYGLDTSDMLDTISDTDTDSAMVSITASRLHQDLSVNQLGQKWIVISLNFLHQCYSFSATILSL